MSVLPMTPKELRAARKRAGMSLAEFANWIGSHGADAARQLRRYEDGKRPIPQGLRARIDAAASSGLSQPQKQKAM